MISGRRGRASRWQDQSGTRELQVPSVGGWKTRTGAGTLAKKNPVKGTS